MHACLWQNWAIPRGGFEIKTIRSRSFRSNKGVELLFLICGIYFLCHFGEITLLAVWYHVCTFSSQRSWKDWAWTSPQSAHTFKCTPLNLLTRVEPVINRLDSHSNNNLAILWKVWKSTSLKMEVAGRKVPSPVMFDHLDNIRFYIVCCEDLPIYTDVVIW